MRVIPSLCFEKNRVFKTNGFEKGEYLGDLLNIVRLYNDLFCDELCLVNLSSNIDYTLISRICEEASMPISYAGSVYSEEQVERLIKLGIEKIVLNSLFHNNFSEYKRILEIFGRSTISLSIDYKGNSQSNFVFTTSGKHNTNISVLDVIQKLNDLDAIPGELVLTSIYKDGSFSGLDFEMFNIVVDKINCPLVLNCGLSSYDEISLIENNSNLSGIMGSGLFVYASQIRGVLINYQLNEQLHHIKKILNYIYE